MENTLSMIKIDIEQQELQQLQLEAEQLSEARKKHFTEADIIRALVNRFLHQRVSYMEVLSYLEGRKQ
jgi:hypothetical protein